MNIIKKTTTIGTTLTLLFLTTGAHAQDVVPTLYSETTGRVITGRTWNTDFARPTVRSVKKNAAVNSPVSALSADRYRSRKPATAVKTPWPTVTRKRMKAGVLERSHAMRLQTKAAKDMAAKCYATHSTSRRLARCLHRVTNTISKNQ